MRNVEQRSIWSAIRANSRTATDCKRECVTSRRQCASWNLVADGHNRHRRCEPYHGSISTQHRCIWSTGCDLRCCDRESYSAAAADGAPRKNRAVREQGESEAAPCRQSADASIPDGRRQPHAWQLSTCIGAPREDGVVRCQSRRVDIASSNGDHIASQNRCGLATAIVSKAKNRAVGVEH